VVEAGGVARPTGLVLSEVEGNPRPGHLFSYGSSASVDSRVSLQKKATGVARSTQVRRASEPPSSRHLFRRCVRVRDGAGPRSRRRSRIRRNSEGCSSNARNSCPSTRPKCGLAQDNSFAMRKSWRRGELNPRPRSLATRRLHAYPDHFAVHP